MASTAKRQGEAPEVPYLSFNTGITPDLPSPEEAEIENYKKTDVKLRDTWTIWEQHQVPKDKTKDYGDSTRESADFSTVKEFWACWNHLPQPSALFQGQRFVRRIDETSVIVTCLSVFKKGVRPAWEDPQNAKGGHFQIVLKPDVGGGQVDELWNNIIMAMVIEAIQPAHMITGARLVDKTGDKFKPNVRVELWFNDMDTEDSGNLYSLKGSFETCMRTNIAGSARDRIWDTTEKVSHEQKDTPAPRGGDRRRSVR